MEHLLCAPERDQLKASGAGRQELKAAGRWVARGRCAPDLSSLSPFLVSSLRWDALGIEDPRPFTLPAAHSLQAAKRSQTSGYTWRTPRPPPDMAGRGTLLHWSCSRSSRALRRWPEELGEWIEQNFLLLCEFEVGLTSPLLEVQPRVCRPALPGGALGAQARRGGTPLGPGRAGGGEVVGLRCRQPASLSQSGCRASPAHAPPWAPEVPYPPALRWRPRGGRPRASGGGGAAPSGEARSGGAPRVALAAGPRAGSGRRWPAWRGGRGRLRPRPSRPALSPRLARSRAARGCALPPPRQRGGARAWSVIGPARGGGRERGEADGQALCKWDGVRPVGVLVPGTAE
eukprot:bmy_01122T0